MYKVIWFSLRASPLGYLVFYITKRFDYLSTSLNTRLYYIANTSEDIITHIFYKSLRKKSSSEKKTKYLLYYDASVAGIEHMSTNLKLYLLEGKSLNRTCVIKQTRLDGIHNCNKEINVSWKRYIDFDKSAFFNKVGFIFYEEFRQKDFTKEDILVVSSKHRLSKEENEQYTLIIRDTRKCHFYHDHLDVFKREEIEKIILYPSKKIIYYTEKVLNSLSKPFFALHIRRRDKLDIFPHLKELLVPEQVLKKLKIYNPNKLPVFLMTDERNIHYYDSLKKEFKIYRYYDFEFLNKMIAKMQDNYFLYMIEKTIFLKAQVKISQFQIAGDGSYKPWRI